MCCKTKHVKTQQKHHPIVHHLFSFQYNKWKKNQILSLSVAFVKFIVHIWDWKSNRSTQSSPPDVTIATLPINVRTKIGLQHHPPPISAHLDRVVEGLKDAHALGAQLQVDDALHGQRDAVVLHGLLTRQHDDSSHRFLHQKHRLHLISQVTREREQIPLWLLYLVYKIIIFWWDFRFFLLLGTLASWREMLSPT